MIAAPKKHAKTASPLLEKMGKSSPLKAIVGHKSGG
jgi:hypothetical protein